MNWNDFKNHVATRMPLIFVFLSGIGFSLQTLIIKLLKQQGFQGSFQCVFLRGFCQLLLSIYFMYYDTDRIAGKGPSTFGDTNYVRLIMFLRATIGYGGIAFSFLSVELIPIGDSTVLVMLSPLIASIAGYFILGEPWRLPEFVATVVSLTGAVFVAKPSFIFGESSADEGGSSDHRSSSDTAMGVTFALIAALSAGFAYCLVRMLGTVAKMPWANVCFAQAIAQIVLSVPSLYLAGQVITFDLTAIECLLIFSGGFIGAWSQVAMTVGMQREKSALATGMRMSDVVFGFLWQALFTADDVSLLSLIGALLVTSSIFILVIFKQVPPPPPPATETATDCEASNADGEVELTTLNPLSDAQNKSQPMAVSSAQSEKAGTEQGESALSRGRRSLSRLITAHLRRDTTNRSETNKSRKSEDVYSYSTLGQQDSSIAEQDGV